MAVYFRMAKEQGMYVEPNTREAIPFKRVGAFKKKTPDILARVRAGVIVEVKVDDYLASLSDKEKEALAKAGKLPVGTQVAKPSAPVAAAPRAPRPAAPRVPAPESKPEEAVPESGDDQAPAEQSAGGLESAPVEDAPTVVEGRGVRAQFNRQPQRGYRGAARSTPQN